MALRLCTIEKPKRSPSKNFCRRIYCALAVTLGCHPAKGGPKCVGRTGPGNRL
jgi:hypothetical protein